MSPMDDLAFLFPGQGSQSPGMGAELYEARPEAREVFAEADEALGFAISRLCFEGTDEDLRLTENTQPAILAVSVAAWRVLRAEGVDARWMAGHSLGEYSALVAAGVLALADAVRLVRKRGRYMQEATPDGTGAMAAVLGLDDARVAALCDRVAGVVEVANLNAPGQVVVAGAVDAVDRLVSEATDAGARRAIKLNVSAPFHCSLMEPAAQRLEAELGAVTFAEPRAEVVCNVDAAPVETGAAARAALRRQVTATVRWSETLRSLSESGVTRFVEVGPGTVLGGLARRTLGREVEVHPAGTPVEIEAAVAALAD